MASLPGPTMSAAHRVLPRDISVSMQHVTVLGAGIAGLITAWYLAAEGLDVTVIERASEPAAETSHANGGHLSTQSGAPWIGPQAIREFLSTGFRRERVVRVLRAPDPGRWRWFAAALLASRPAAYRLAAERTSRLSRYSRPLLEALIDTLALDVGLENRGALALYRSRNAFRRVCREPLAGSLLLNRDEVLEREPALAEASAPIAGACFYPADATADCHAFCEQLSRRAVAGGVRFFYDCETRGLELSSGRVVAVTTSRGRIACADCVVALGAEATPFLSRHALRLPILPLRGYSLSVPIESGAPAPGRFVDIERHMVFSRLAGVFRAAGMADFAGHNRSLPEDRTQHLHTIAGEWYPPVKSAQPRFWACLRAMTPDGPPVLGASGIPGLWLNIGLGPLGWTQGAGGARLVVDLVLGRKPGLSMQGYGIDRF